MTFFKFLLISLALLLAAAGIYSLFPSKLPEAFTKLRDKQENPFTIPADSVYIIRERIQHFFIEQRRLLSGGTLEITDSSWHLPYYNSHRKGNRVLISMNREGDRFRFDCHWWYSGEADSEGDREIALYLQKGVSRYDY